MSPQRYLHIAPPGMGAMGAMGAMGIGAIGGITQGCMEGTKAYHGLRTSAVCSGKKNGKISPCFSPTTGMFMGFL